MSFKFAQNIIIPFFENINNICIIKKALKCADKKAEDLTELVDKEGRAIIKVGDYKECRKIQDIVERNSGRDNQPLKVSILPAYLVAHQLFAIKLCLWLENLFSKCSGKQIHR